MLNSSTSTIRHFINPGGKLPSTCRCVTIERCSYATMAATGITLAQQDHW